MSLNMTKDSVNHCKLEIYIFI